MTLKEICDERAKERAHEEAMHRLELEHSRRWQEIIRLAIDTIHKNLPQVVLTLTIAATICWITLQIRIADTSKPKPTPTAEQMFGMGGR